MYNMAPAILRIWAPQNLFVVSTVTQTFVVMATLRYQDTGAALGTSIRLARLVGRCGAVACVKITFFCAVVNQP